MENSSKTNQEVASAEGMFLDKKVQRRSFLKYAGAGAAGVALVAAGCKKNRDDDDGVSLGSGDVAVLNYAYALEQLEAAFYTQVVANPYSGITPVETAFLTDIRDHEIAHREFFKAAIAANGGTPIPTLRSISVASIFRIRQAC
jgi:hypothetical protein